MAINGEITEARENGAIDMMVSMVADEIANELHITSEDAMVQFLQSDTCRMLYDKKTKLWWEGPSEIVDMYLKEDHVPYDPM